MCDMKLLLIIAILSSTILLTACDKGKFETKPLIEVKNYNSKEILANGSLVIRLDYFDKEGDIGDGVMYVLRKRLNVIPPNQDRPDLLNYMIPKFNDRDQGELRLEFQEENFLSESTNQNDTMIFRIAVTDRAGNASDTITTDQIVVIK
jgi:hypothetical protein